MSWSLKRMFGRSYQRRLEAGVDRCGAEIRRLAATADRLNQELNRTRRELAEERGKTQAAMVKYAQVCTEWDDAERMLVTARADVKELTGQREDQAQQIEELRRERRVFHVPVVAEGGLPGTWAVYCQACSDKANTHVWPCADGWAEMVPQVLVGHEGSEK